VGTGVGCSVGLGLGLAVAVGLGADADDPLQMIASRARPATAAASAVIAATCRGLDRICLALLMLILERVSRSGVNKRPSMKTAITRRLQRSQVILTR
jgi:hypothetical protein